MRSIRERGAHSAPQTLLLAQTSRSVRPARPVLDRAACANEHRARLARSLIDRHWDSSSLRATPSPLLPSPPGRVAYIGACEWDPTCPGEQGQERRAASRVIRNAGPVVGAGVLVDFDTAQLASIGPAEATT